MACGFPSTISSAKPAILRTPFSHLPLATLPSSSPPLFTIPINRTNPTTGFPRRKHHILHCPLYHLPLGSRTGTSTSSTRNVKDGTRIFASQGIGEEEEEGKMEGGRRVLLQSLLWGAEAVYILWLFLLPYAPGDPVWAISSDTIHDLLSLSLNFFFILPVLNGVGIHTLEAPVLNPVSEGLFNFVIGWTFMFAPLLFTDYRRNRYKGSLDLLWVMQMFLTNAFLIPYMAIRLNDDKSDYSPSIPSKLAMLMTRGATVVAVIGGLVCFTSLYWSLLGRESGGFGGLSDRWEFFSSYIGSERLAYAFIWDIILYSIFQPWLIGNNLKYLKKSSVGTVATLRFVPVLGLLAYLSSLDDESRS